MEFQVDKAKAELPHLHVGGSERASTADLIKELIGLSARPFIMAREPIERFTLHAPVLHDLRRKLHKIPRNVGAGQGPDRRPG